MKPINRNLKLAVGVVALAATCSAHAIPYAYATLGLSNLTLTGLDSPGVTITNLDGTVTTSSAANYPGAPESAKSASGGLETGADSVQAFAGPGVAPGENVFGQQLVGAFGTRGDARLAGNLLTGDPAASDNLVAEGRLQPFGSAASAAGTSTGFEISFATTEAITFTLSALGLSRLIATTDGPGEGASAQVNASFTITGGDGVSELYAPRELNFSVSSTSGSTNGNFSSGPTDLFYTVDLDPGLYQFSLLSGVQERLQRAEITQVPEPGSLGLLAIGLAGACGFLNRRKRVV